VQSPGRLPGKAERTMTIQPQQPIDGTPRLCLWCCHGTYRTMVDGKLNNYRNYGLGGAQPEKWRLLRCDTCGHVQWFREA